MNELQITEYKSIRVLTTQQIAEAYGSDTRVISNNFNRNKERYIEALFKTVSREAGLGLAEELFMKAIRMTIEGEKNERSV